MNLVLSTYVPSNPYAKDKAYWTHTITCVLIVKSTYTHIVKPAPTTELEPNTPGYGN